MDYNLDDIYVTNGGSEAIAFAVMTTCDPGDNILMFEPFYANYKSFVGAYNVEISGVPTSAHDGTTCPVKPRSKSTSIPGRGHSDFKPRKPDGRHLYGTGNGSYQPHRPQT